MMYFHLPYEQRYYSQHGEDGIISQMVSSIVNPNKFVFEIGWGDGTQNMSRRLIEQGWTGIGIDGFSTPDEKLDLGSRFVFRKITINPEKLEAAFHGVPQDLDFFSLDIDSFDFEVAQWMLSKNYRPKTVCLEFNHRFGPKAQAGFPYVNKNPKAKKSLYNKKLFHGASLDGYRALWTKHGYKYFGFDSSCVNVFFYDPTSVKNLDHLPINDDRMLPTQQDIVRPAVIKNSFWSAYLDKIYRTF